MAKTRKIKRSSKAVAAAKRRVAKAGPRKSSRPCVKTARSVLCD